MSQPAPVPSRLGKYDIRRQVGRGAMGVVYEGFDPAIGRTVAIKVLELDSSDPSMAEELHARFSREAHIAGQLNHPNIVTIYDYCEAERGADDRLHGPFIVMEFVEGGDLKRCLDPKSRLALPEIGRVMANLLAALQYAHEKGVVHRDIKPANVMIVEGGMLKVADFGIARIENSDLTRTGAVMGTVAYMSPEQLTGAPVDRRTDVYSSGVILYELLTGEPPFVGSVATIIQKVLNQEALPPSALNPGLPRALDAVVRKALAKKPAARYLTADAFARAIIAALANDDDATVVNQLASAPSRGGGRAVLRLGLTGFCVIAVGLGAFVLLIRPPNEAPPSEAPAIRVADAASTASTASTAAPASSPDVQTPPSATPQMPSASRLQDAHEIEQLAWGDARRKDRIAAYQAFLKGHPRSQFSSIAHVRLAALSTKLPALPEPSGSKDARTQEVPRKDASSPPLLPPPQRPSTEDYIPPVATAVRSGKVSAPVPSQLGSPAAAASTQANKPRTEAESISECNARALAGDKRCQVVVADMYRYGQGVARDLVQAAHWYRKAADQGEAVAQNQLGWMYAEGLGLPRDLGEAFRWHRRAADQGNTAAQTRLGWLYEQGNGVSASAVLAADWYRKAADQGFAQAQNNLARMYRDGRGVFKDSKQAVTLFQAAAAQGSADAAYNLGRIFELGNGVVQSNEQASAWYRKAMSRPNLHVTPSELARTKTYLQSHPE